MPEGFWLNDTQWERLAPLLPNKPRGVARVDDRRGDQRHRGGATVGGTLDRRSGRVWSAQDALQSLRALVRQRRLAAGVHDPGCRRWSPGRRVARQHPHQSAPLCCRRKRGFKAQAIGVSRGGRTTKIHALSDGLGRPLAFVLTGGQAADCRAAEGLLQRIAPATLVMADRAYDTNAIRKQIEDQGAVPNIPPRRTRPMEKLL